MNGTLATDGILPGAVKEKLRILQELLAIYVVTADTHGTAAHLAEDCGGLEIAWIEAGEEAEQKGEILEKLGASQAVALEMVPMTHQCFARHASGFALCTGKGPLYRPCWRAIF